MIVDFENLKEKLKKTKRGVLILNEQDQCLIKTEPDRPQQIKTWSDVEHPLLGILEKDAFVPANASIPVLADNDVLSVFRECSAWSELPRFYVAGARQEYHRDPTHLTVGVLTAGGNAPGLDTIVDSLVKRQFLLGTEQCRKTNEVLTEQGYPPNLKFYGIVGGYRGLRDLTDCKDRRWVMELHPRITDPWVTRGCSSLHALRTDSYNMKKEEDKKKFHKFISKLANNVRKLRLDILYTIGGNGTMSIADALGEKLMNDGERPCLVIAGPKTMDNDINFTDVTFGFRTTVDNAIQFLRDFHREAETLERVGIVELFGAASGFVALHAAYASGEADYVLIPEMMGETFESAHKELNKAVNRIKERAKKKGHALLVVAEGATVKAHACVTVDSEEIKKFEHGKKVEQEKAFTDLVNYIKGETGCSVFYSQPRHLIRATPPNGFDTDLCKYTGKLMVDTALLGFTCCAVHLWQGNYVLVPLKTAVAELKKVDISGYYFISMWEKYMLEENYKS